MPHIRDIRVRDPFIYTDREAGCYYMYGTTDLVPDGIAAHDSFSVWRSTDLVTFEEPRVIFRGSDIDFWADRDYWAAEMHPYGGKYYLFASCKAEGRCRATHIFVSDTPDGIFRPVSAEPPTPADWECLDGTLFVEEGVPYMVFSHEWLQVHDGEICALPLLPDLTAPVGEPVLLFRASENPHVRGLGERGENFITDGPFLWREGDRIRMIWSSFSDRYLILSAEADSIRGPWRQGPPLYDFDGGHAMLFETLEGKRMISLHSPNTAGLERARFLEF